MGGLRTGLRVAVWMGAYAGEVGEVTRLYPGVDGWSWVVIRTDAGAEISAHAAVVEPVYEAEAEPREYVGTLYPSGV